MRKRNIPHDIRPNTLHNSNNHGCFVVTCYISPIKIFICFLETGNEYLVRAETIKAGRICDSLHINKYKTKYLTQKRLKHCIEYNSESGIFLWKISLKSVKKLSIGGCKGSDGYKRISIDHRRYMAHRLAWLYMTGEWPKGQIDHINHVRDDNRFENLRDVTMPENQRNRKINKSNTSGFTGVRFRKNKSKWEAQITINGECRFIGSFKNKNDAVIARKMAEQEYGFHANHGA